MVYSAARLARSVIRRIDLATRPMTTEAADAVARRWHGLPEHVKTPAQIVGRRSLGCEGTHGVFPQCDFACTPCYHSTDANKVRIDGEHTVREVSRQMAFLQANRGPAAHAQLIGGEVSLLAAEDHAATIAVMRAHGRMPMSFTHGDIDEAYLRAVALDDVGRPRFRSMAFAGHFDTTMRGRRGAEKPTTEAELDPFRARFAAMFARLKVEHGISSYLAHNMTVTPDNVGEVAGVIRRCSAMGYRMFSFQPAAYVGNETRWHEGYRTMTGDDVWAEIERGAGVRLPYGAIQFGDVRCNRTCWGAWVGERFVPVFDDLVPADLAARDLFYVVFPGNQIGSQIGEQRSWLPIVRAARSVVSHPSSIPVALRWAARFVRRVIDTARLAWVEQLGNRQYITAGNMSHDDRLAIIAVDYRTQRRVKMYGRGTLDANPSAEQLERFGITGRNDGLMTVEIEAISWNCPKYISPRFTLEHINNLTSSLTNRIAQLESELHTLRGNQMR